MAKLSRDDVLKLAKLARLELSDDEVGKYADEISSILTYVEQLNDLDLDSYEPTSQVTGLADVMRPDVVQDYGYEPSDLLKNAPDSESGYLKVRRII